MVTVVEIKDTNGRRLYLNLGQVVMLVPPAEGADDGYDYWIVYTTRSQLPDFINVDAKTGERLLHLCGRL